MKPNNPPPLNVYYVSYAVGDHAVIATFKGVVAFWQELSEGNIS